MTLNHLHKGDQAVIVNIDADKALKDRFLSFGIMQGEELTVKECSIARQTMEILVGQSCIALRAEEAMKIKVNKT